VPLDFYRFRSIWRAPATPDEVFHVLADLGNYPLWWPEVRSVRKVAEDCAELVCRSLLPYQLLFRAAHSAKDEGAGLLRARLTGDLDGFASWRIIRAGGGSRLIYDQEVTLRKSALRPVAVLVRPALRANHELMMRNGQRGLRTYLAGWNAARNAAAHHAAGLDGSAVGAEPPLDLTAPPSESPLITPLGLTAPPSGDDQENPVPR
jgi:hypothetical protein